MFARRFRILRLSGFDVHIDASWIFIALLVVWSLAAAFFPAEYPNLSGVTYAIMGIVAAVGFFGSIVIHEYCHSIVARHYGMPMKGITLWMLGGVAEMSDEPPSPKAEFWMAAAGPASSIGIALLCYVLAELSKAQQWSILATGILAYLWRINLILVLFNLIPAFPLDGGRLLRAVLWAWKGKMRWATRIASRIGGAFGAALMILGVFALFTGNPVVGVWYFIIGLFIRFAAQASYTQLLVKGSLSDVSLQRLVKDDPVTVNLHESIEGLVEDYFYRYQHRMFPVTDDHGSLQGCVRMEAIREIPRHIWNSHHVQYIMEPCSESNSIDHDQSAYAAMQQMHKTGSERLMIVDRTRNKALGVLTRDDILRFVSTRLEIAPDSETPPYATPGGFPMPRPRPT